MKQADFHIGTPVRRHRRLRQVLSVAILEDLPLEGQLQLDQRTRADLSDIRKLVHAIAKHIRIIV
jgi:hypothetical protein